MVVNAYVNKNMSFKNRIFKLIIFFFYLNVFTIKYTIKKFISIAKKSHY